ncbi:MAG: helix-turn-helix transcriptional regulator [Reyranellaceae bacterium]
MPFCYGTRHEAKALKPKDFVDEPLTFGQHLKKRRRELGLLQREVAKVMGVSKATIVNWENGKTTPAPARFRPALDFLGYDPTPTSNALADRLQAKRRALGVTFSQVAQYLGWNDGTLTRYLNGTWQMPPDRALALEAFLTEGKANPEVIHRMPRRHQTTKG